MGPTEPSTARRVFSYWYLLVALLLVGMFAFIPFLHAAIKLERRGPWVLFWLYLVANGIQFYLIDRLPMEPSAWDFPYYLYSILVCVAAVAQLNNLRREVLALPPRYPVTAAQPPATASEPVVIPCGLLSVDVEASGAAPRDSEAFVQFRHVLFAELAAAFEASRIPWNSCLRQDTGDGMIVLVPPEFPKSRLVYPLLERLAAGLRHHNRYAGDATRIRVRVALHGGDIRFDGYGATGRPKVLLARLLAADPLRQALAAAPPTATVAVLTSDSFYEDVVCHGHEGIDPDLFAPVTVREKETEARAWLHIPGHAASLTGITVESAEPVKAVDSHLRAI